MPEFILDYGSPEAARAFDALDAFTKGYIEAMFFTNTGSGDDEELEHATVADLAPETLEKIKADCAKFLGYCDGPALAGAPWSNRDKIERCGLKSASCDLAHAGRDFWFTSNGHGVGFWDGNWPKPYASELDKAARSFRGVDPYRGDDGLIYLM
jgi:hypothetical protein